MQQQTTANPLFRVQTHVVKNACFQIQDEVDGRDKHGVVQLRRLVEIEDFPNQGHQRQQKEDETKHSNDVKVDAVVFSEWTKDTKWVVDGGRLNTRSKSGIGKGRWRGVHFLYNTHTEIKLCIIENHSMYTK